MAFYIFILKIMMKIHVKLSATLREHVPGYDPEKGMEVEIAGGASALDLAARLNIPAADIKFVMLNGRYRPMWTILEPNDRVAYFPAVGGG